MSQGSNQSCICSFSACKSSGGQGDMRLPTSAPVRRKWLDLLRPQDPVCSNSQARVSAAHFSRNSLYAIKGQRGHGGTDMTLRLRSGALPTVSDEAMKAATQGALARCLRAQAVVQRHSETLVVLQGQLEDQDARILLLEETLAGVKKRLKEAVQEKAKEEPSPLSGIDDNILKGKTPQAVRCLIGLSSHDSLEKLYGDLDYDGAATHMIFYGDKPGSAVKSDGSRPAHRKKQFRGVNGLFFTLFVLRTATPIAVASALFGASQSTGGKAFTTWVIFLARSLKPFVRLPLPAEVAVSAPENFKRSGLSKVAIVLDATEVEVDRVWHKDASYVLYSPYKGKPTGKLLVCITSSGAICYISLAFGGRLSDVEVVRESGLINDLREGGFADGGFFVMADRGFNSISPLLLEEGINFVAPPWKRRQEPQFNEPDANLTREVANLRIHVERAIGAMKKWRIIDTKFSSKQLDLMGSCFLVCGAFVNMFNQPFVSKKPV